MTAITATVTATIRTTVTITGTVTRAQTTAITVTTTATVTRIQTTAITTTTQTTATTTTTFKFCLVKCLQFLVRHHFRAKVSLEGFFCSKVSIWDMTTTFFKAPTFSTLFRKYA